VRACGRPRGRAGVPRATRACPLRADCCDGSDEFDGTAACPNVCRELAREATEGLQKQVAAAEAGVVTRREWAAAAARDKADKEAELQRLDAELSELRSKMEAARGATCQRRRACAWLLLLLLMMMMMMARAARSRQGGRGGGGARRE
jgi:hypothetical protein